MKRIPERLRPVYDGVLRGETDQEIAAAIGKAPRTVRDRINDLAALSGVEGRPPRSAILTAATKRLRLRRRFYVDHDATGEGPEVTHGPFATRAEANECARRLLDEQYGWAPVREETE